MVNLKYLIVQVLIAKETLDDIDASHVGIPKGSFIPHHSSARQSFQRKSVHSAAKYIAFSQQLAELGVPLLGFTIPKQSARGSSSGAGNPLCRAMEVISSTYNLLAVFTDNNYCPVHHRDCQLVHSVYPDTSIFMIDSSSVLVPPKSVYQRMCELLQCGSLCTADWRPLRQSFEHFFREQVLSELTVLGANDKRIRWSVPDQSVQVL